MIIPLATSQNPSKKPCVRVGYWKIYIKCKKLKLIRLLVVYSTIAIIDILKLFIDVMLNVHM